MWRETGDVYVLKQDKYGIGSLPKLNPLNLAAARDALLQTLVVAVQMVFRVQRNVTDWSGVHYVHTLHQMD